jgi:hypothetical protein
MEPKMEPKLEPKLETKSHVLSKQEITTVGNIVRTCTSVIMCKNIIKSNLFSNGISFSHRRGRVKHDPHMQEIMNDHWLPFCEQMVDSVLVLGIAVVRIVTLEDGLNVPVVLEPNACQIAMVDNQGIRSYTALDHRNEVIENTLVIDRFGASPTISGRLTSLLSSLIPEIQYMNSLRGTSLHMEIERANPVVLTEIPESSTSNTEGIHYDYYADGDMQSIDNDNTFHRNQNNVAQLAQQQDVYDAFFTGDVNKPSRGSTALEKIVALPIGQRVASTPHHTGRSDLVAQQKMFQDTICGVLGVPRSLVMSDTPHKSDSEGTHQTFMKTIMWWKKKIQASCEQVYNLIYAENIQKQLLKSINSKKRKAVEIHEMYALKKRIQVQISFPVTPFMGNSDLFLHYQRGVINWATYVECASKNASLPFDLQNLPPEPPQQPEPVEPTTTGTRGGELEPEGE